MQGVFPPLNIEDEPLLHVLHLLSIANLEDLLEASCVVLAEFPPVAVEDCSLVQQILVDAVVLPSVDEALQNRRPSPVVVEHFGEAHPMSERDQTGDVCESVVGFGELMRAAALQVLLVETIDVLEHVGEGVGLGFVEVVGQIATADGVGADRNEAYNSVSVDRVVEAEKGTHEGGAEGVVDEDQRFVRPVLEPLVDAGGLQLDLRVLQTLLDLLLSESRLETCRVDDHPLPSNPQCIKLAF